MIPCDLCWILCFPLFVVFWLSLLIIFYYRQLRLQRVKKYEFDNKTVLVITAHPDDECMFFSPSILNLPRSCRTIHVLCLTTGMPKTEVYHLGFSCVYTIHLSPTPLPKLSRFFSHSISLPAETLDKVQVSQILCIHVLCLSVILIYSMLICDIK